ncbi:type I restriction endonuclease subunit R [Sulfurospirillum multivorans]|uniref:Type I restriction enzyme endonuclease subunit n=2 Tax=Sulfurospirillum multivorans TaxID=66821 RepID=A0AA86E0K7_SULMK|nr:type I restriction endonuclease subunit R [Sulfurospirillum multivorans]AHJ14065.1 type I restriction-modification system, restriction subunit R [Sulfurospirillum multivorans DSM 12446]QEH07552.1 type I restriction-modification system, restriction subunit R [Sulfurospirillum multivorans]
MKKEEPMNQTQSEAILEENLITQLVGLGYEKVTINDDKALEANLKSQLEKRNQTTFSEMEFKRILNHLSKNSIFDKAKTLRDKFNLERDDGTIKYVEFLDSERWCQNLFQVTNQVSVEGMYKTRYDVTLLINGFPLVQIELKRRGLELKLKEAFNQTNRYQRHSYGFNSALFQYIQIFVISNGVNTKYYSNNKKQTFKQTFFWADVDNKNITNLEEFTQSFLERCHISKMICKYIVLAEAKKILMVLRPYQFYAVEAIISRVKETDKNGYIWHTTGSGKTLTSFKTAQILTQMPEVHKVVFVVDRKDLDIQTTKKFNSFSNGSVDGTDNTGKLVTQFCDETKLIVTTIQKLNSAISKKNHLEKMENLKDKRIVFIFDECHRSQFGQTHKSINKFFTCNQMIGFTGTPIFAENAVSNELGKRTTKELFDERLHKYVITDENVLKFSIEYIGRYSEKHNSATNIDIEVESIDTKELLESDERIGKITDYIIAHHDRKTHAKEFTAMMCVSSVDMLIKYYETFKAKKHNLKIATIFSYSANEEDKDANGIYEIDESDGAYVDEAHINKHSREKLDEFIKDYNAMFGTKYSTKDSQNFYNYYNDISKKVKNRDIDILLVVNMFLTGFDSPSLNTMYVDKNLRYHGLIQAFSRTNRTLSEEKSQGNIVCFRNLKKNTDEAIALFSNIDAKEIILMKPYEEYVAKFNEAFAELLKIAPSVASVDALVDEEEKLAFVKAFRALMRLKNILVGFSDFKWSDVSMRAQAFEDYKSKYLDMYDATRAKKEKVSILEDVDFELELIVTDEINVAYILKLLGKYKNATTEEQQKQKEALIKTISGTVQLRSKRELIEKFINDHLMHIDDNDEIENAFEIFWDEEKLKAFDALCKDENLVSDELKKVMETYIYDERIPLKDDVAKTLNVKPKLLERKVILPRVLDKIVAFVEKFYTF